jgi:transposase
MRYVGLDVHKRSVRVCVIDENGKTVLGADVACERTELEAFCRRHLQPDDEAALEATTNTWAVAEVIRPLVGKLIVSNPLRTKAIAQAKIKTDKIDAKVLAQLLRWTTCPRSGSPTRRPAACASSPPPARR